VGTWRVYGEILASACSAPDGGPRRVSVSPCCTVGLCKEGQQGYVNAGGFADAEG
jgi:hypothetical protein